MEHDRNELEETRRRFLRNGAVLGAGTLAAAGLAGCPTDPVDDDDTTGEEECPDYPRAFPNQGDSEVRWGFLIDLTACRGCHACSVACKTESDVRLGVFRNSVIEGESGTYPDTKYLAIPWLCNHCEAPSCLDRCPTDPIKASLAMPSGEEVEYWARATYQRPDGLVLMDQDRCVGCGRCVEDCTYGARFLDWAKAAGGDPASVGLTIASPKAADKCDLCVHRLEQGLVPACVNTCPADARMVGNLNDPNSAINAAIAAGGADVSSLKESSENEPRVFYIGLDEAIFDDGYDIRLDAGRQYETPGV